MERSCRVTVRDIDGIEHTAVVTAESLYEAVARGIASLRRSEWVEVISEDLGPVKISVVDTPVEHSVSMKDFLRWLERSIGSPRDVIQRKRVREILDRTS